MRQRTTTWITILCGLASASVARALTFESVGPTFTETPTSVWWKYQNWFFGAVILVACIAVTAMVLYGILWLTARSKKNQPEQARTKRILVKASWVLLGCALAYVIGAALIDWLG